MPAIKFGSRVKETSNTTGTGTISLLGATEAKYQRAADSVASGSVVAYMLLNGDQWEEGFGTFTDADPDTVTRTLVLDGSLGPGTKINLAGTTIVLLWPAARLANLRDTNLCALDNFFVAGGSGDAITGNLDPPILGYSAGLRVGCIITAANTVTNPTLALNGLGGVVIKSLSGGALLAGDQPVGRFVEWEHDGTNWRLLNAALSAPSSLLELQSTDAGAGVGPNVVGYRNSPSAADQDFGATTQADFNTTGVGASRQSYSQIVHVQDVAAHASAKGKIIFRTISGGVFAFFTRVSIATGMWIGAAAGFDMGVGSLNLADQLYINGVQAKQRRLGSIFTTPYALNTSASATHGLGARPTEVSLHLICTSAAGDQGFAQNECAFPAATEGSAQCVLMKWWNATHVGYSSNNQEVFICPKAGGTHVRIDPAKWSIVLTPWLSI